MSDKIFLLPLFVESIRRSINLTQEKLALAYDNELNFDINVLSGQLCSCLKGLVGSDDRILLGPKVKVLTKQLPKTKIVLHQCLTEAISELEPPNEYSLTKIEAEAMCNKLISHIKEVLNPLSSGAGSSSGGTDTRTVKNLLKPKSKPKAYALKFMLTKCIAPLMVNKDNASYVRDVLFSSKTTINETFFSYSKRSNGTRYHLENNSFLNSVIEEILQEKIELFSNGENLKGNELKHKQQKAYQDLFIKISDRLLDIGHIPESLYLNSDEQTTNNEVGEQYSIKLGRKAKQALYILLGPEDAIYVWNDISSLVYKLSCFSINQADLRKEDIQNGSVSEEEIVETTFFYLFFTLPQVMKAMEKVHNE